MSGRAFLCLAVCCLCGPLLAQPRTFTSGQLTSRSPLLDLGPANVSGSRTVYSKINTSKPYITVGYDTIVQTPERVSRLAFSGTTYSAVSDGRYVAWDSFVSTQSQIFVNDTQSGVSAKLSTSTGANVAPKIANGIVVWRRQDGPIATLIQFDLAANAETVLPSPGFAVINHLVTDTHVFAIGTKFISRRPIGGGVWTPVKVSNDEISLGPYVTEDTLTWMDNDQFENYRIQVYDVSTGAQFEIGSTYATSLCTDGEYVIWYGSDGVRNRVFVYSTVNGLTSFLADESQNVTEMDASNGILVFREYRATPVNSYAVRIVPIEDPLAFTLVNVPTQVFGLKTDGDVVVWAQPRALTGNLTNIVRYDIADETTERLTSAKAASPTDRQPSVAKPILAGDLLLWLSSEFPEQVDLAISGEGTVNALGTAATLESDPDISGQNVAWVSRNYAQGAPTGQIFFNNGTATTAITNNAFDNRQPAVDGNRIVWVAAAFAGSNQIMQSVGGVTTALAATGQNAQPAASKGRTVWQTFDGTDWDIMLRANGTTTALTTDDNDDINPRVESGRIVWQHWDGSDWEIYLRQGNQTIQLTDNGVDDRLPDVYAELIVWCQGAPGEATIKFLDLSEPARSLHTLPGTQIGDESPRIDGRTVAFLRTNPTLPLEFQTIRVMRSIETRPLAPLYYESPYNAYVYGYYLYAVENPTGAYAPYAYQAAYYAYYYALLSDTEFANRGSTSDYYQLRYSQWYWSYYAYVYGYYAYYEKVGPYVTEVLNQSAIAYPAGVTDWYSH